MVELKHSHTTSRCAWTSNDPLMIAYHDEEWGVPVHDDLKLFEFLVLDAFQAGLSWLTILKKRESFRNAFDGFDPVKIAGYGENEITALLGDISIIRNKAKIQATITNARAYLQLVSEQGSFAEYVWRFVNGQPVINHWTSLSQIPAHTPVSDAMSKDLKKRGFSFVGSTICYAFMQAAGLVNDHTTDCFRYEVLRRYHSEK